MSLFRFAILALIVTVAAGCSQGVPTASKAQALVDQARWTVESFKSKQSTPMDLFRARLREAQGVVIIPGAVKAGFLVGAEYGDAVMVARDASGTWGYPAFYSLGGGSIGLQIGGQVAEIVLVVRSRGALESLIRHQGKIGADAEITVGTVGAGVEGAVTTNLGADIVAFSSAAGVFAGGSLEGSALVRRNDYNAAYYGAGATPQAILLEHRFANPSADALRTVLAAP